MTINRWLLETLQYYRKMHFFQEYQAVSDLKLLETIEKEANQRSFGYCQHFFEQLLGQRERNQWSVLGLDRQRIIQIPFDLIMDGSYFVGITSLYYCIEQLNSLAQISRGVFQPENTTGYYINDKNEKFYSLKELAKYLDRFSRYKPIRRYKIILSFDFKGMRYSVIADAAASVAAAQINHLIVETGYQFYLGSYGEPTPMLLLTQAEQEKLREERDLQVRLILPRVEELIFTYEPSSLDFYDDDEIGFEPSSLNFYDDDEIDFEPSSLNFYDDDEIDFEPSSLNFYDDD